MHTKAKARHALAGLLCVCMLLGSTATALAATNPPKAGAKQLTVEGIAQNPELPHGCEVTSLAIVLRYLGYDADKTELAQRYLPRQARYTDSAGMPYGGDPEEVYLGNPFDESTGWYCWAAPLAKAAGGYLARQDGAYTALDITGADTDALAGYIDSGIPVVVWTTIDGSLPTKSFTAAWQTEYGVWYRPYTNVHCMVLTGYDDSYFYFTDPLETTTRLTRQGFATVYGLLGSRALVLTPA